MLLNVPLPLYSASPITMGLGRDSLAKILHLQASHQPNTARSAYAQRFLTSTDLEHEQAERMLEDG